MKAQVFLQLEFGASQPHSQDKLENAQTWSSGNMYGAGLHRQKWVYFNVHRLTVCVSGTLLQIFSSDFPVCWILIGRAHGVVWSVKPKISSPKRNFPDSSAGTRCCVSCVTCSFTYTSASLVIFEKDNFYSCYPSEILPSISGENSMAQSGYWCSFNAPSHLGIFCRMMPFWVLLGLFTGFLWASPHYYPNGDLWWMRLEWEKRVILPKAIFMFDKDDALPKMVQYEHTPAGHKIKKRIGMGITVYFLITDFRFVSPWFFSKILLFPGKQYLNTSVK